MVNPARADAAGLSTTTGAAREAVRATFDARAV
jgi:hypothetical protein